MISQACFRANIADFSYSQFGFPEWNTVTIENEQHHGAYVYRILWNGIEKFRLENSGAKWNTSEMAAPFKLTFSDNLFTGNFFTSLSTLSNFVDQYFMKLTEKYITKIYEKKLTFESQKISIVWFYFFTSRQNLRIFY